MSRLLVWLMLLAGCIAIPGELLAQQPPPLILYNADGLMDHPEFTFRTGGMAHSDGAAGLATLTVRSPQTEHVTVGGILSILDGEEARHAYLLLITIYTEELASNPDLNSPWGRVGYPSLDFTFGLQRVDGTSGMVNALTLGLGLLVPLWPYTALGVGYQKDFGIDISTSDDDEAASHFVYASQRFAFVKPDSILEEGNPDGALFVPTLLMNEGYRWAELFEAFHADATLLFPLHRRFSLGFGYQYKLYRVEERSTNPQSSQITVLFKFFM